MLDAEAYFDSLKDRLDKIDTLMSLRAESLAAESLKTPESVCSIILDAVYEDDNDQAKKALVDIATEQNSEKLLNAARILQNILYAISYKANLGGKNYEYTG